MASCFNSFGPAQTYVISRVWACSHMLLAGLPFPLNPLQPGFAAGIRWGVFGVLGASPGVMQGSVNSSRGTSLLCKIAGGERGAACTNLMHLLGLVTEQGGKTEGRVHFPAFEGCKNQFHKWWCVRSSISPWKDLVLWQSLYKFSLVATETHPFIAARCCFVKRVVHLCADLGDRGGPRRKVGADRNVDSFWGGLSSMICPRRCLGGQGGAVSRLCPGDAALGIGRASGTQP